MAHASIFIFGVIIGFALCAAIVLFMTETYIPASVLLFCALAVPIAQWKWAKYQQAKIQASWTYHPDGYPI